MVYDNLSHLWCVGDVSPAVKDRVYGASVRVVLLRACESRHHQVRRVKDLFVFVRHYLRRIAGIQ